MSKAGLAQSAHAYWQQNKDKGLASKGSLYAFAIDELKEYPGFNPRDYDAEDTIAHIRALADAYKRGVRVEPIMIKVVDGHPWVWDGHCRLRGAKLAISEGCVMSMMDAVEMTGDEVQQSLTVLRTKQGLPLKPLEIAVMISRLVAMTRDIDVVAMELGKSRGYVTQYLDIYNLPLNLKDFISDNVASWSTVLETVKKVGVAEAFILITKAANDAKHTAADADATVTANDSTESGDQNPVAAKPVKIKRAAIAALSGYRPSFSPKLVVGVTDSMKMLESKLPALVEGSTEGATLTLNADEIAILRKIIADVKPKGTATPEESGEVGGADSGSMSFEDLSMVSASDEQSTNSDMVAA